MLRPMQKPLMRKILLRNHWLKKHRQKIQWQPKLRKARLQRRTILLGMIQSTQKTISRTGR